MIGAAKDFLKRHWPLLRLRTILLIVLLVVAAMPVAGMVLLRVYENTLVRQTEVELVSQGAALSATAQALWPGAGPPAGGGVLRCGRRRNLGHSRALAPERPPV